MALLTSQSVIRFPYHVPCLYTAFPFKFGYNIQGNYVYFKFNFEKKFLEYIPFAFEVIGIPTIKPRLPTLLTYYISLSSRISRVIKAPLVGIR